MSVDPSRFFMLALTFQHQCQVIHAVDRTKRQKLRPGKSTGLSSYTESLGGRTSDPFAERQDSQMLFPRKDDYTTQVTRLPLHIMYKLCRIDYQNASSPQSSIYPSPLAVTCDHDLGRQRLLVSESSSESVHLTLIIPLCFCRVMLKGYRIFRC